VIPLFVFLAAACVALVVVVVVVFLARGWRTSAAPALSYRKCNSLLSPAERSFIGVLEPIAADLSLRVFCKVRLADVLLVPRDAPNRQSLLNRTSQKHLDFVLCEPDTLAPALAVELDDASHCRQDRQRRDEFVDAVCAVAELPVLHARAQHSYVVADVRAELVRLLGPCESNESAA
jgi:hypothetical protein